MFIERIPKIMSVGKPATNVEIDSAEILLNRQFSDELRLLLSEANGVEADLVQIYSCENMPERNETYEVSKYAPGYILFGVVNGSPVFIKKEIFLQFMKTIGGQ